MVSTCVTGAAYIQAVDWENDGAYSGLYDDITEDVLDRGISVQYGREQNRQLSPGAVGRSSFVLCNADRIYSPENVDGPLYGDLGPARSTKLTVELNNVVYSVHTGRIDDFTIHPDRGDRTADFTTLDGMALLQRATISTELMIAPRTGQIVDRILDEIGWVAPRDIDVGATFPRYWWAEGDNAFDAMQEIVRAEGPPAAAYVAPDGTFVFQDRHHRIQNAASLVSQATFSSRLISTCDACLESVELYGDGCYGFGIYGG